MNKRMCSEGMIVIKKLDQLWITLILFSFFLFFVCLFVFVKKKKETKIKITIKTGNSFQEI